MARAPDPKAAQAKEMFLAGKKLIEIAETLGVPEGTVRSWKNRYGWANATLQKPKRNVARKRGGQPGNKNAVGHGGTGPPGNKNAVTTGEFETLLFDCLDPEERRLADAVPADKEQLILQEIRLLTVREHRMLRRIEALRKAEEYYAKAPQIVSAINAKENSIEIWKDIYLNEITPCVKTALQEGFHSAYEKYSDMTQKLLNKYLPDQDGGKKDEL